MVKYNPLHPHCGPFNEVDDLEPTDPVDAACWRHDIRYGGEEQPYTHFNEADQKFIDEMEQLPGIMPKVYASVFKLKRRIAPRSHSPIGREKVVRVDDIPDGYIPIYRDEYKEYDPGENPWMKVRKVDDKQYATFKKKLRRRFESFRKSAGIYKSDKMPRKVKGKVLSKRKRKRSKSAKSGKKRTTQKMVPRASLLRSVKRMITSKIGCGPLQVANTIIGEQLTGSVNVASWKVVTINTMAAIDSLSLARVYGEAKDQYDDEAIKYDAVNRPLTETKLRFLKGSRVELIIRNNDDVDQVLDLYAFSCLQDSSETITNLMTRGYQERTKDAASTINNIDFYPSLAGKTLSAVWRMNKHRRVYLRPSQEVKFVVKCASVCNLRRSSLTGVQNIKNVTKAYVIRSMGTVTHDNTNKTFVGYSAGTVDIVRKSMMKFRLESFIVQSTHTYNDSQLGNIAVGAQAQPDVENNNGGL